MKHRYKCLTAFLLVFALLTTTASFTGTAKTEELDLSKPCSLTVNVGKHMEELRITSPTVRLIQVADAVAIKGYDAYSFDPIGRYTGIELNNIETSDEWRKVAKEVAKLALEKDDWDEGTEAPIETVIPDLAPGLYLVVPYNPDNRETIEVTEKDGTTSLATTYDTQNQTYIFTPSLVSLPTKAADADGVINSAGGDWIYNAQINLKAEQEDRLGGLEIIKTLTAPPTGGSATFVFSVYGTYWKDVKGVWTEIVAIDDVFAITFDGNSLVRSLSIEGIPAGATVTVTEIYSGVSYQLITDANQTVTISAEMPASVDFTNAPNDSANGGGGIVNKFTFQGENWDLEPTPFGAASVADS